MLESTFLLPAVQQLDNPPWEWFAFIAAVCFGILPFLLMALGKVLQSPEKRRLDILAKALDKKDLDPELRQQLIETLRGQVVAPRPKRFTWTKTLLTAGWLGLFTSASLVALAPDKAMETVGIFFGALSFALVTLPFVFREAERRGADIRHDS